MDPREISLNVAVPQSTRVGGEGGEANPIGTPTRIAFRLSDETRLRSRESLGGAKSMEEETPDILILGLNPAFQKIISVPTLNAPGGGVGGVHRAQTVLRRVGGKGQNCAKAASAYLSVVNAPGASTERVKVHLAQFVGRGYAGQHVEETLSKHPCITQLSVHHAAGDTRTCDTLIGCNGNTTEIVEPSSTVSDEEVGALRAVLNGAISGSTVAKVTVVAGTTPPGVPADFYRDFVGSHGDKTICILDGYRNVEEVLLTGRVTILKINCDEFLTMMNAGPATNDDPLVLIQSSAKVFFERYGVEWLALTNGGSPALLFGRHAEGAVRLALPADALSSPAVSADPLANPIGAGDTVTGVMASLILLATRHGKVGTEADVVIEAFRRGLACASGCCLRDEGGVFEWADAAAIYERITVTTV